MLLEKNTLFGPLVLWFTGCRAVSPGQSPFWASASTSVPGAPASSLVTGIQLEVLKPGVEIWAPVAEVLALLSTLQPAPPTPSPTIGRTAYRPGMGPITVKS